ncbi:BCLAF1 and THRAP3 family member 3-like [Erpetoichthys calabaricus]|uniref:BCLAF1 and THRAP3 family member 3-like n=1 Tax=Erpetoichthys calabaricus TaxID=27687 RepID=UPI002234C257|nr:BCLAF1 and THRAP3 family member 3-like [Erpetoichthys calabaricus]XP_051782871.1 BCLAF1 and THRAP3 family member 3-like [Erpetoichthys calabaricus]
MARPSAPRYKYRSTSPSYRRSPEPYEKQSFAPHYNEDFRDYKRGPGKHSQWKYSEKDKDFEENNSRIHHHDNGRQKYIDYRQPLPNAKRMQSDSFHGYSNHRKPTTTETFHTSNSRRPPSPDRPRSRGLYEPNKYPEEMPSDGYERQHYEDKTHKPNRMKSPRHFKDGGKDKPYDRSLREEKWQDRKDCAPSWSRESFSVSPRRSSEEFHGRSSYEERNRKESFQPGYPVERGFRDQGHSREMERYQQEEAPRRSPKWKRNHSPPPFVNDMPEDFSREDHRPVDRGYYEEEVTGNLTFNYAHKHPSRHSPGNYQHPKSYPRQEEDYALSSRDKEGSHFSSGKIHSAADRHPGSAVNQDKTFYGSPSRPRKADVDLRPQASELVSREKFRNDSGMSKGNYEESFKEKRFLRSELHYSGVQKPYKSNSFLESTRGETLTIKVDMKHTLSNYSSNSHTTERQLSQDLVAVSRRGLDFQPLLKQSGSLGQSVRHSHTGDFAQEIISLVHQVKESYFKTENVTLNDRFSNIQEFHSDLPHEERPPLAPKINRRIDLSLSDLKMKKVKKTGPSQANSRVAEDPNDLRHDIERRRKERLQDTEEHNFAPEHLPEGDHFTGRFKKSSNFMRGQHGDEHFPRQGHFTNFPEGKRGRRSPNMIDGYRSMPSTPKPTFARKRPFEGKSDNFIPTKRPFRAPFHHSHH